jgi:hypothetical protein
MTLSAFSEDKCNHKSVQTQGQKIKHKFHIFFGLFLIFLSYIDTHNGEKIKKGGNMRTPYKEFEQLVQQIHNVSLSLIAISILLTSADRGGPGECPGIRTKYFRPCPAPAPVQCNAVDLRKKSPSPCGRG